MSVKVKILQHRLDGGEIVFDVELPPSGPQDSTVLQVRVPAYGPGGAALTTDQVVVGLTARLEQVGAGRYCTEAPQHEFPRELDLFRPASQLY